MEAPELRRRGRVSKDGILEATVARFHELGYHGTSMRDIASEAGVNVASIYNHYRSKQALLQQIMVDLMTEVLASTKSAIDEAGPEPADRLRALMRIWVIFHARHRAEALISASELRSLDEEGRRRVVALRDEQEAIFRAVVREGVDAGVFTTPWPEDAARAIISMGVTIASWYRPDGSRTPEEMADRYAELALGTVGGPADHGAEAA
jgi:AcrR family transcriptional regulator